MPTSTIPSENQSHLSELTTIQMVLFFGTLRKTTMLAHRREFDLTEIEWRMMTSLGVAAPLSLNGLAEIMLLDLGQLSRTVKSMVERGIITRNRKPGGPEIEIGLSETGWSLYAQLVDRVEKRDETLIDGIAPDELAIVRKVIAKMAKRAKTMLESEMQIRTG